MSGYSVCRRGHADREHQPNSAAASVRGPKVQTKTKRHIIIIIIRPPDIIVGGLIFYQGFFFFYRRLISELADRK